jgi:hypothetical protein
VSWSKDLQISFFVNCMSVFVSTIISCSIKISIPVNVNISIIILYLCAGLAAASYSRAT